MALDVSISYDVLVKRYRSKGYEGGASAALSDLDHTIEQFQHSAEVNNFHEDPLLLMNKPIITSRGEFEVDGEYVETIHFVPTKVIVTDDCTYLSDGEFKYSFDKSLNVLLEFREFLIEELEKQEKI